MTQRMSQARAPAASSELVRFSRPGFLGQPSSDGAALRGGSHMRQPQTMAAVHASSSVTPAAMPAMPPSASVCALLPTGAEAAHAARHFESQWSLKDRNWPPGRLAASFAAFLQCTRAHAIASADCSTVQRVSSNLNTSAQHDRSETCLYWQARGSMLTEFFGNTAYTVNAEGNRTAGELKQKALMHALFSSCGALAHAAQPNARPPPVDTCTSMQP